MNRDDAANVRLESKTAVHKMYTSRFQARHQPGKARTNRSGSTQMLLEMSSVVIEVTQCPNHNYKLIFDIESNSHRSESGVP